MSTNAKKTHKLNDIINNKLKYDISNSIFNNPLEDPLPIVTIRTRGEKKSRHTLNSGLTCVWDSGSTEIMINLKHINYYKSKLRANKVEYSTDIVTYKTKHGVNVPFIIKEFCVPFIITDFSISTW